MGNSNSDGRHPGKGSAVAKDIFSRRRRTALIALTILAGLYAASSAVVNFNGMEALHSLPMSVVWLARNFLPSQRALASLPIIADKLAHTFLMSVASTTSAAVFALLVAVFGSRATGINRPIKAFAHVIASFFRNMPLVAWAMILLISFKQNEFTGYLAIFFTSFGYLTRAFMESIDEVTGGTIEALTATGAGYFQIVFQGVIPMVSSQLISWLLYMIENNVRDATLVGLLTGTGIGFLFDVYYKTFRYDVAGTVTLAIVLVVIGLELLSNRIRRMIL